MNIGKFNSLYDLLEAFPTEESCIEYLEQQRWANGIPVSPYDPTSKVYNRGDGMYRCKNTGKNFNVRIGTMFEGSKLPLRKWFVAIYEITSRKKGISSIELSKRISVTYKTAWFMNQRIRECFGIVMEEKLDGEVELDETFYKSLTVPILRTVKRTATLFSDEWCGYKTVSKLYEHYVVDHGHGQYVDEDAYTNNIEGFWSILKRGLTGIYNHTSKKHLQRYVNEFCFRYNTRDFDDVSRFNLLLCNSNYRITFQSLTK